jgi:hypothetical protein
MTRSVPRSRALVIGAAMLVALLASACVRPITGPGSPAIAGIDVTQVGYQRSEFFLFGKADADQKTAPLTSDGKWQVQRDPDHSGAPFNTRMVVHRPADPAKFNGTVVIEWMNVSAGSDLPNEWTSAHNEFVRSGTVWIGLSAQAVGVNQLKSCCAARYGNLDHPGDSYSYDIFTTAARDVRANAATVLGGLVPQRVIGAGESQSASRLVTYINAVHPLVHVYDGFLVHSRGASGAQLSQSPLPSEPTPSPSFIRDDLAQPVFVVQSEDDMIRSQLAVRQPDTATFRLWEMAGTAHADAYMTNVGFSDIGNGQGAVAMLGRLLDPGSPGACAKPFNAGASHWILQAAYNRLDHWIRTGTPPASGAPLAVASTGPVVLARDAYGNAQGGVRSPHVDAPLATVDGLNSGPSFCSLFGSTTPFTAEQLLELYPTHQALVDAWGASVLDQVANGFLLGADAFELYAAVGSLPVPSTA